MLQYTSVFYDASVFRYNLGELLYTAVLLVPALSQENTFPVGHATLRLDITQSGGGTMLLIIGTVQLLIIRSSYVTVRRRSAQICYSKFR